MITKAITARGTFTITAGIVKGFMTQTHIIESQKHLILFQRIVSQDSSYFKSLITPGKHSWSFDLWFGRRDRYSELSSAY